MKKARKVYSKFVISEGNDNAGVSLEEAADAYVGNHPEIDEGVYTYAKRLAFKAGAKWMAGQGLTQVCRVKAVYDSHGADYGVRFLRIEIPDDTPVGEEIIVKIIPKTW